MTLADKWPEEHARLIRIIEIERECSAKFNERATWAGYELQRAKERNQELASKLALRPVAPETPDAVGPDQERDAEVEKAEAFNRAKNWLHTQFGSHTNRDIWEKLTPDDVHELAAEFMRLSSRRQPAVMTEDRFVRNPEAGKCNCGLHIIQRGIDGVNWYWQHHTRLKCTVELPNEKCWCGLLRSEHIAGHDEDARLTQPAAKGV